MKLMIELREVRKKLRCAKAQLDQQNGASQEASLVFTICLYKSIISTKTTCAVILPFVSASGVLHQYHGKQTSSSADTFLFPRRCLEWACSLCRKQV